MVAKSRHDDIENILIQITHEYTLKINNCIRLYSSMLTPLLSDDMVGALEKGYAEILKIDEECKLLRRDAEQQLMSYGALLIQRAEYIRLIALLDKILDKIEGAAYRTLTLHKLRGFDSVALAGLSQMTEKVHESIEMLRECLRAFMLHVTALHEKLDEIERYEKLIDGMYRGFNVEILQSKLKLPHMILVREVAEILEDIADHTEEISNILRVIYPRGR
ncbi:MAG: DUF47 family protein [Nitrososphaerota archaeon]|nr:DUF47 family protein [Candidatus Calditenuaceae archaeon]MDW8073165.1 DUF47 family protein [Nitrososphaerota archaeon]